MGCAVLIHPPPDAGGRRKVADKCLSISVSFFIRKRKYKKTIDLNRDLAVVDGHRISCIKTVIMIFLTFCFCSINLIMTVSK